MLLIDSRAGSKELYMPLVQLQLEVQMTTLGFADVAFIGNGPSGPMTIGIEHKKIGDLVQSLMTGRLQGHQLPGCITQYDRSWLIVEGLWRTSERTGLVEAWYGNRYQQVQPAIMGRGLNGWLFTVELRGGMKVVCTRDREDSVEYIAALYRWWTDKEWHEHRGHLALYLPPDAALFYKPTLVQQVAALLPGIGEDKSAVVDRHFGTVLEMACAGASTWQSIPGIGQMIARRAVEALQGDVGTGHNKPPSSPGSTRSDSSSSSTATCSTTTSGKRSSKRSKSSTR